MDRNSYRTRKIAYNDYNLARICVRCYSTKLICIHHKDEDPWNDAENNLEVLCRICHTKLHTIWRYWKHSKESKQKMRELKLWWKHTEEHKEKIRISMLKYRAKQRENNL